MHQADSHRAFAGALRSSFPEALPCHAREHVAQEALDLVAVVAGLKPVAWLGCGTDDADWLPGVERVLAEFDVSVTPGTGWIVATEIDGLPDWYVEPMMRTHRASRTLLVHRCDAVPEMPVMSDDDVSWATAEQEARWLGYPVCCVQDHHRRRRRFHRLTIDLIRHFAGPEEADMRRFAASEVVLRPNTAGEISQWREATRCVPAPYTSVNMCLDCEMDTASPARQLSQSYGRLADDAGLGHLFLQAAA